VKLDLPFITLQLKNLSMSTHPVTQWMEGEVVKSHPSTAMLEINLYSPGVPVHSGAGVVIYRNSARDELAGFCHFLEFPSTENLLLELGISILLEGSVLDVTAILDGIDSEYRAMAEFSVDFTQTVEDPYASDGDGDIQATGYFTEVEINYKEDA
jgi:hypothetical protein